MKCTRDGDVASSPRDETRQPVIVREVRVDEIEAMMLNQPAESIDRAQKRDRILRLVDDRMGEIVMRELRLQLVTADVRIMRIDPRRAQRLDFGERRRGCSGPAIGRREMQDFHLL